MSRREIDQIAAAAQNEEYKRQMLQSRREFIELRLKHDLEIKQIYIRSAQRVAGEIRKINLSSASG